MKKQHRKPGRAPQAEIDDILPVYDFSHARPNKYAARYAAEGGTIVVLDPDVAAVFQSPGEVNDALRALSGIITKHGVHRTASRRTT